jgi:DNA polymerase-3 subunit gamma/tau
MQEQPQEQQRSLYRRHRPRSFADVVGQEPVVRTLRNAVQRGKVHHAYLFVGSRGTGKTSMAKILAACLNCEQGEGGGTIEPCGRCDSCVSIARATSLDVIEMDAASNNSVDDIRELRESVAYAPVSGRRKVYILDEAHMLSTAAWNAFLKTLEEPPPNTVFVLATTEANKVPATVVDRCHRFDFHRPTVEQIASVVRRAAAAESIEIPPPAVAALARSATGSFRDALGTLEQLVTYSGSDVALEDVLAVLGVADARLLEVTVDAVAASDAAGALRALEECVEQGRDAGSFASDLEVRARELLIVQTLGEVPEELSLTPEADAALGAQAERVDHAAVVRLLELLGEAMEAVRAGADARTRLELALVKASKPEVDGSMRALLARIERLEGGRGPVAAPVATKNDNNDLKEPPRAAARVAEVRDEAIVERDGSSPSDPASASTSASPAQVAQTPAVAPDVPEPPPPAPPVVDAAVARDLESVRGLWSAVVDLVLGSGDGLASAAIAKACPVAVDGETLTLAFPLDSTFHKKTVEAPKRRAAVSEALRSLTGVRWQLSYELREAVSGETAATQGTMSEDELIARFKEEFNAEEIGGDSAPAAGAGSAQDGERDVQVATGNEKGA